jgi:hypothetical protein
VSLWLLISEEKSPQRHGGRTPNKFPRYFSGNA